jgi:hypothetical protein
VGLRSVGSQQIETSNKNTSQLTTLGTGASRTKEMLGKSFVSARGHDRRIFQAEIFYVKTGSKVCKSIFGAGDTAARVYPL